MNITKKLSEKRFAPGKGVAKSSPKSGPARFFFLFATYFWRLIGINLLFVLCCIPIVTIPTSLCALNRYLIIMVRDGYGFSLYDYWKEWKCEILRSIPCGVICVLPVAFGYYLLSMSQGAGGSELVFTFGVFWTLVGLMFSAYVFVLMPMLDLSVRYIFKNAFILMISEWKSAIFVLITMAVSYVFISALFPFSLIAVAVFFFAWLQLILCSIINTPVQKRIIGVYEAKMQGA